jgi:filamentous hemagglutinin family protein
MESQPRSILPAVLGLLACSCGLARANPQGLIVQHGSATLSQSASALTLNVSQNAVLNWSSFNIAAGQTTTFVQPSSHSVVWNQIAGATPSQILGTLNANGNVVLINASGFYFGSQSVINVAGLIATAAPVLRSTAPSASFWQYDGPPPAASIINYGRINAATGGSVYLIADAVENNGSITAPDGKVGLYAGKQVLISDQPDGRGLTASVTLPAGSVDNNGRIIADAGAIALQADVVNQNGLLQANSVRNQNGVIDLVASDSVALGTASVISAAGDQGVSAGGSVSIKSANAFSDQSGSLINVSGGAAGGNGGQVNLCAEIMPGIASRIEALASPGWTGGGLFIDPTSITLGNSGKGTVGAGGTVGYQDGSGTLQLNVNSAFVGFSQIDLQASQNITLAVGTVWNLDTSTGISSPGCKLTLEAGQNIIFDNASSLVAGPGWSVELVAGRNFSQSLSPSPSNPDQTPGLAGVTSGTGGIYLNGGPPNSSGVYPQAGGSLESDDGSIDLRAGKEIIVGTGYIRTDGGGNISIVTGSGNVNAGSDQTANQFTRQGTIPNLDGVGGIATQAGGDVAISVGNSIVSTLATVGCYGAGDVTLTAQNSITGTYQVVNGAGVATADSVGTASLPISLSLAAGSWTATAQYGTGNTLGDIFLNEVFNPNGSLNSNPQSYGAGIAFQFNYAANASVSLTAGNSVNLLGSSLATTTSNPDRPPIYPPILNITAGAGGVNLGNDLVLYPAADAALNITTTAGGSLASTGGLLHQIVMSDSGNPDYTTFIDGHSTPPLQEAYAGTPVVLNINGSIDDISLQIPKETLINVGGNAVNFYFTGQNLLPGDTSRLTVTGDIIDQTDTSSVTVPTAPNLSIFDPDVTGNPLIPLSGALSYNAATHQLTFTGRMTADELTFLLNPTVVVVDQYGHIVYGADGLPETQPVTFESASIINQLYNESLQVPSFSVTGGGILFGGPGNFIVSANNMNLGVTEGIRTVLGALNPDLGLLYSQGANLQLTLQGNLEMTSSQIASFNGGSIAINAGGNVDLGVEAEQSTDDTPKGVYTGHGGDVSITADGNINVDGSRVAAYDGGNVTVDSVNGNVDAGAGQGGYFQIYTMQDGVLREDTFFGSGILALTAPESSAVVGNISITAGENISADSGGIVQLPFNHSDSKAALVTLSAGQDILSTSSGIVGENITITKAKNVVGLLFAQENINIGHVTGAIDVTALAGGNIGISDSQSATVSGQLTGGAGVSVDVGTGAITATLISTGGTTSTTGDASGAKIGAFHGVAFQAAEKTVQDAEQTVAQDIQTTLVDDEVKRGNKRPLLAKSTGRVTILLPSAPSPSPNPNPNPKN